MSHWKSLLLLCASIGAACDDDGAAPEDDAGQSMGDGGERDGGERNGGERDGGERDGGERDGGARADGGARDGSVDDGGALPTDAGPDASLGGCAAKPWKLCEDFEGSAANNVPTGWTNKDGWASTTTYTIATDQARSGTRSFKNSTASPGSKRISTALGELGAKHWGRLYYRVASPAPIGKNGAYYHVTFASLLGPAAENRVVDTVESPQRKIQYLFNLPDDSCCAGSSYDWAFDGSWHCAEWNVDVAAKSYKFFIDGSEVTAISFTNKAAARMSNYTDLVVGSIFYVDPDGALSTWIDDVAVDDDRIGCAP